MVNQPIGNHVAGNLLVLLDLTLDPPSRSNEDSQT